MYKQICLVAFFALISCCYAGSSSRSSSSSSSNVDIRSETTCQTHKRNAGGKALMEWDIQCDNEGLYLPLQCTKNTPKWCSCYNKEESITSPSRGTKSCECHLARDLAMKNSALPCDVPKCHRSGKYEKRQCCEATRKCRCVDPTTGATKSEHPYKHDLKC